MSKCLVMKRSLQQFSSFKLMNLGLTNNCCDSSLGKEELKLELDEHKPLFHVHWGRDPHDLAVLNSWTWAEWTSASMTQLVISSAGSRTETLLSWITLLSNRKRSFSRQERWVEKEIGWTWTLFAGPLMKRYSQQFSNFNLRTLTWITLFSDGKRS